MASPKASLYFDFLHRKYPKAAIIEEASLKDPDEQAVYAAWQVSTKVGRSQQHYMAYYDRKKIDWRNAIVPDGYSAADYSEQRRIDYLMLEGDRLTAVEMKVSRSDFKRDTEAKRRPWFEHSHRFVYLTPAGLLKPEEVPAGCGLWEVDEERGIITVVKKAQVRHSPRLLPQSFMQNLLWRVYLQSMKSRRNRSR